MADRIKGITIAFSGDTSGLQKAIKEVNSDLKSTQNGLRDVERLLKLDPSNVELLEQKQRLLSESTEETTKKLELLYDAQGKMLDEMEKAGGATDEQTKAYDALRREIIETNAKLDKNEDELAEVAAQMEQATSKTKAFEDGLGKVGKAAETVAGKTKRLSIAAGGAIGGIVGMAVKGGMAADELNTLAKQTGLSTDTLQEMKYASELVDVSYETMTGSAEKMVTALRTNEDAFGALGIATRDANGEFLSSEEIYFNAINALGAIDNEVERDIAAQELFGRSAADLAGLIDDGGAAFRNYAGQAQEMGLVLSGETLEKMNAFNDQVDIMKAQFTAALFEAAAPAIEALSPLLSELAEWLGKLIEFIGTLDADTVKIILTVLAVVAAISPVAALVANITGVVSTMIPVVKSLFLVLSANPIGLIITLIAAVATAVYMNWDKIKPVLDKIKEVVLDLFDKIKNGFLAFKDGILKLFEALKEGIKKPINIIIGFINKLIDGINFLLDNPLSNAIGGLFGAGTPQIPRLQALANGGVVTSGGAAIVGEAGPEILTVNGPSATVTPITPTIDTSGIERALAGMNGSNNPTVFELNIDGKAFARATYDATMNEALRRGGRLVTV